MVHVLEPEVETSTPTFDQLHEQACRLLGPLLAAGLDDLGLAEAALQHALAHVRGRWARDQPDDALVEVHRRAFAWATEARWPRSVPGPIGPGAFERCTRTAREDADGDGERALVEAIAELPIRQRSAVLGALLQGWSSEDLARAHGTAKPTVELRVTRGLDELSKQLQRPAAELEEAIVAAGPTILAPLALSGPELATVESVARRTAWRNRVLAVAAGLSAIVVVGGIVRVLPDDPAETEAVVETVDPPRSSQQPHAPIGDGRGGFVALGRGAGLLSTSTDGIDWYAESRLNVNRINLRLFVERFFRSGDRYIALIESSSNGRTSLNGSDAPRVAIARDVGNWEVIELAPGPLPEVEGLTPRLDLISAAAAGDRVLLGVRVEHEVDYVRQRLRRREVCAISNDAAGLVLHRCEGEPVQLADSAARSDAGIDTGYRLLASDDGETFVEIPTTDDFNPWGLFSYGDRFAMINESTSSIVESADGEAWAPLFDLGIDNRLGLVAGSSDAVAAIAPTPDGWVSHLVSDGQVVRGTLPLTMDPTTIWIKPEFVHGPAGWAVFLTTSRPWERRGEGAFGWAVHDGDWLVEQRAGSGTIRVRSTADTATYDYQNLLDSKGDPLPHPHVDRGLFGDVRARHPATGEVMVEISGDRIRRSWVTGEDAAEPPQATVSIGEHTVTGNLRTGPITLSRPDGSSTTWTDGFDFTDGSVDDGVETDWFDGVPEPVLRFYVAGVEELVVPISLLDELDLPPVASDPDRTKATVVYSPDGINWRVIWESNRDTWYGSVAVGDDEVLLSISEIVAPPRRLLVDAADQAD